MTRKIKKDKISPDTSPTTEDITARITAIHTEATLDHNTWTDTVATEAAHDNFTQHIGDTATDPIVTHHISHITDHPHITALWDTDPKITVGHMS